MHIAKLSREKGGLAIIWDDNSVSRYPFVWLRDNDPGDLHPQTRERVFDLTSIDFDIEPESIQEDDDGLSVCWPGQSSPSLFRADWLRRHRPGARRLDPARIEPELWDSDFVESVPRFDAGRCISSSRALREALVCLKRFGLIVVEQLADNPDASMSFGKLIGFRRETNFGNMFEVINKPDANNLAYTELQLPLHTDLPNQEIVPGYQFLHAYRNEATGGESVFADGFRICADLKEDRPDDYDMFRRVRIPWRFHDTNDDIRSRRPIITEDDEGHIKAFTFNAHIADIPDMDTATLTEFYPAYQRLMRRTRKANYAVRFRIEQGEMAVFDNTRVMHGRAAFEPSSGERHFRGYYIEKNEVDSRLRVLSRRTE